MKRLNPLLIDDRQIISTLADNQQLNNTSYPHLRNQMALVLQGYDDYELSNGNPWLIVMPNVSEILKAALRTHYSSPPNSLNFLDRLRKSSPEVCPMCGGFHPTTLDHYLPKANYPAWAIFSKNLIPACGCNMARGNVVKDNARHDVRVLHPYYDDFLRDRILTTRISHSANFKWIKAVVESTNFNHPHIQSINFHISHVVSKSGFDNWQRGQLSKLMEFPANVIQQLPRKRTISMDQLIESLTNCLDSFDELRGTPNNWDSMLMHGLLHTPGIHDWLLSRHNEAVVQRNV